MNQENNLMFHYQKNDNSLLFKSIIEESGINVKQPQNYIPIYQSFFSLTSKNYNDINLNNKIKLIEVKNKISNNVFVCTVLDENKPKTREVFFKYSPLLDPSKYLIGKYDTDNTDLLNLPSFHDNNSHKKVRDPNNAAYIDGFFTYLTSKLLHTHGFIHAIDFYGSFLSTKVNFEFNVMDDIEHLNESEFFHKHNGTFFTVDNHFANVLFNFKTRRNKEKLKYVSTSEKVPNTLIDEIDDEIDGIFTNNPIVEKSNTELDLIYNTDVSKKINSNNTSECSSDSSRTSENDKDNSVEDSTSEDYSTASEEDMIATIPEFPVNVIALEKCSETLDAYINENIDNMTDDEWGSIIIQIIMMLLAYQKTYGLTHNDLHTNNIMYIETDILYVYYKAFDTYYKVPTFGKIYKIIDFGRAIYKFRGNIICSDSYHPKGDAANLYNFEPYLNEKKPRLEPNFSFDLCRLGCSLLDFFIDDMDSLLPAKQIIMDWCLDDKGRNVLYKNNGEERYPDFKLYKMIARTVHNSTPEAQLQKEYFNKFRENKKDNFEKEVIINIDDLPCYM